MENRNTNKCISKNNGEIIGSGDIEDVLRSWIVRLVRVYWNGFRYQGIIVGVDWVVTLYQNCCGG